MRERDSVESRPPYFKLDGWLMFALSLIAACLTLTAAAFGTFETQDHARENRNTVERRLERIEEKIDRLLSQEKSL